MFIFGGLLVLLGVSVVVYVLLVVVNVIYKKVKVEKINKMILNVE